MYLFYYVLLYLLVFMRLLVLCACLVSLVILIFVYRSLGIGGIDFQEKTIRDWSWIDTGLTDMRSYSLSFAGEFVFTVLLLCAD